MSTENTAVEVKKETAAPSEETVTRETVEVDYEAELKKKDDELVKIREEKENYKRGLLKAKGKIPDEDDNSSNDDETLDAKIDRKVQERLLATKEAQILAEKDAVILAQSRKLKELSLAVKNRSQISNSGQGSNQEMPEPRKDNILSNDQISSLKTKGWSDEKIEAFKKNLARGNDTPK